MNSNKLQRKWFHVERFNIKTIIIIIFLSLSLLIQNNLCDGGKRKTRLNKVAAPVIVDNLYSSVVLISHSKLKTSAKHVLSFVTLVAPLVAGHLGNFSSFGIGNLVPGYTEKSVGTGFQTEWGIVTNSHVIGEKQKMVLTTFYKSAYHLKGIEKVSLKDNHSPFDSARIIKKSSKGAIVYDWGDRKRDLALIRVKVPGAYPLKLATKVNIGEKVFSLGHPKGKEFVPSEIGTIERISTHNGIKHLELSTESKGGMSGSPILNIDGEVVGILSFSFTRRGTTGAVHVEELRKAIGLRENNIPVIEMTAKTLPMEQVDRSAPKRWTGRVYSTEYTHLYHRRDCDRLIPSDGLIRFKSSQEAHTARKLPCNYCKP